MTRYQLNVKIHKQLDRSVMPLVTVLLLDWSVRERFHALDWLEKQNVDRDLYELMWVEIYDRVVPEVIEKVDTYITCGMKGLYNKHIGYNVGLLHAQGKVLNICDSDAVFPPDFIESIIKSFNLHNSDEPESIILMHYEWRTGSFYPDGMSNLEDLKKYKWLDLWANVGACASIKRHDAIRFGGFDEHPSYRGYMCGVYDLVWRMVNAGIPEIWHSDEVALWHFAHPDPVASFGQKFSRKLFKEITYPHLQGHALKAVEAFSTGRILPLQENPDVFKLRMSSRRIGTAFEEKYAWITNGKKFTLKDILNLYLFLFIMEPLRPTMRKILIFAQKTLGDRAYFFLKKMWYSLQHKKLT